MLETRIPKQRQIGSQDITGRHRVRFLEQRGYPEEMAGALGSALISFPKHDTDTFWVL